MYVYLCVYLCHYSIHMCMYVCLYVTLCVYAEVAGKLNLKLKLASQCWRKCGEVQTRTFRSLARCRLRIVCCKCRSLLLLL